VKALSIATLISRPIRPGHFFSDLLPLFGAALDRVGKGGADHGVVITAAGIRGAEEAGLLRRIQIFLRLRHWLSRAKKATLGVSLWVLQAVQFPDSIRPISQSSWLSIRRDARWPVMT
jgi:hypothetical protein